MRTSVLAGCVAALVMSAGAASALPAGNMKLDLPSQVEKAHFAHGSCQRGPAGWHYHVRGQRISCDPRPSGRYWGWKNRDGRWGWWHERERRWWR